MSRALLLYRVHCPLGMLHGGRLFRTFTSADAFNGYVRELRRLGMNVIFASPMVATVAPFQATVFGASL